MTTETPAPKPDADVAKRLRDVLDVSRERVDFGAQCMPWLRVGGLRFS